ncbi:MAG: helix-turn-helix transcriptional regulator [Alphaproteobacteria bacterium]|nr:helix-turn-helix transcriptional regulator [Alphaproteobacteria bacterium]
MTLSLGEKIRKHRDEKRYSLDKLAELSDSSKSYLWELENPRPGKKAVKPSAEKLSKVASVLSVTVEYLLDDSAQPDERIFKEAFYRKFSKLDPQDQKRIEEMIESWGKK